MEDVTSLVDHVFVTEPKLVQLAYVTIDEKGEQPTSLWKDEDWSKINDSNDVQAVIDKVKYSKVVVELVIIFLDICRW